MPMAPNTMDIAQDGEADRMLTSAQGRAETQPPVVPTMVPEAHASIGTEQGPTQMAEAGTQPPGSVGQTEGWNPSTRAQHPHAPDEGGGSVGGGYVPERDTPQTAVDGITLRHSSVWAEFSCITESEGLEVGKIAEKWKDRLAQHC